MMTYSKSGKANAEARAALDKAIEEKKVLRIWGAMLDLYQLVQLSKPGDGSDAAAKRTYALMFNDLERMLGFYKAYAVNDHTIVEALQTIDALTARIEELETVS